jgi:predicted nucleic acid-binding protein
VKILVDTSVWSLALRRKGEDLNSAEKSLVSELRELIQEGRAAIIGMIRQELLSGIRTAEQYNRLREYLRSFPDESVITADYEEAARAGNLCRTNGIVVATVDALLSAVAMKHDWPIFTTDMDFENYATVLPIKIHRPRK